MKRAWLGFGLGIALPAVAAAQFVKPPDLGPHWQPLSASGTYVYSDRFVAPAGLDTVNDLGMWLVLPQVGDRPEARTGTAGEGPEGGPETVRFEIWGVVGPAPDPSNVIASTGSVSPTVSPSLTYFGYAVDPPVAITPGQTYFFVATRVAESGSEEWTVGGHTQNSVYNDNGTFWYSNDPAGIVFDGQEYTPEMAFAVNGGVTYEAPLIQEVPALGKFGLLALIAALALAGAWALKRT